jgi:hypothetical protein
MISDLETAPERIARALRGYAFMPARSLRQRGDEHRALAEPAVQADEAHLGRLAAGLIERLAVIDGRDELRAYFVGELVFFDVRSRDRELLERRIFAFEFDRGEFLSIAQAVRKMKFSTAVSPFPHRYSQICISTAILTKINSHHPSE